MTTFHIVFRPRFESLPEIDDFVGNLIKRLDPEEYLIACEKGSSTGDETFNHYDVYVKLKKERRADKVRESILRDYDLDKQEMKNIKCYEIVSERINYQIGYAQKESIHIETNLSNDTLKTGREVYERSKSYYDEQKKPEEGKTWTVNDFGKEFRIYLQSLNHPLTISLAESEYIGFVRKNRDKVSLGTYHRLSKEKVCEYVSDFF